MEYILRQCEKRNVYKWSNDSRTNTTTGDSLFYV